MAPHDRRPRIEGRSAWTLSKKLHYALDSIFNFTDLPIRLLLLSGTLGTISAVLAAVIVLIARLRGRIPITGYTPLMLLVAFFGGLTTLGPIQRYCPTIPRHTIKFAVIGLDHIRVDSAANGVELLVTRPPRLNFEVKRQHSRILLQKWYRYPKSCRVCPMNTIVKERPLTCFLRRVGAGRSAMGLRA